MFTDFFDEGLHILKEPRRRPLSNWQSRMMNAPGNPPWCVFSYVMYMIAQAAIMRNEERDKDKDKDTEEQMTP